MSKLNYYQFTLPTHTNTGASYEHARKSWEKEAVKLAGGVTSPLAFKQGVWVGDEREYRETVAEYTVACDDNTADKLLGAAFRLFPDQEAIFRAQIGTASIFPRPKREALADPAADAA